MRSTFFWEAAGLSLDRANPYGALLARALARVGVELTAGHPHGFDRRWIEENRGEVDILHLNWPHTMYDAPDLAGRVARAETFITNLTYARRLGYRTSGASEMIFMWLRDRSSRTTGPKIRVPTGSF